MAEYIDYTCPHCGWKHFKRKSGRPKYSLGAMQCHVFVEFLMEEMDGWGFRAPPPKVDREPTSIGFICNAPCEFTCFHKGSKTEKGKTLCMSSDGFDSETPEDVKLQKIVTHYSANDPNAPPSLVDETWKKNDDLMCPHRQSIRVLGKGRANPPRPAPSRARHSKGYVEASAPRMPGHGDDRKERVYSELFRRISFLRNKNIPITPQNIAKLGGFTKHAAPEDRGVVEPNTKAVQRTSKGSQRGGKPRHSRGSERSGKQGRSPDATEEG